MRFKLKGTIQAVERRLFDGKKECYGTTQLNKNRFAIKASTIACEDIETFNDTILHELLHLWLFIYAEIINKRITKKRTHRIIEAVTKKALRELRKL